jgi:hypothetical protein
MRVSLAVKALKQDGDHLTLGDLVFHLWTDKFILVGEKAKHGQTPGSRPGTGHSKC